MPIYTYNLQSLIQFKHLKLKTCYNQWRSHVKAGRCPDPPQKIIWPNFYFFLNIAHTKVVKVQPSLTASLLSLPNLKIRASRGKKKPRFARLGPSLTILALTHSVGWLRHFIIPTHYTVLTRIISLKKRYHYPHKIV